MSDKDKSAQILYRFEYFEPEDNQTYVDWVWLDPLELNDYKSNYNTIKVRPATADECDLYEEAYADGYGMAAMMEFESKYDGVTFRIKLDDKGELDFEGTKMFECAVCTNHKDFEDDVAMSGDMFLGVVKEDKLWHICYECAMIGTEISNIEIEVTEEDGS